MKTREEVARFIEKQLDSSYRCPRPKGSPQRVKYDTARHHYGAQELRELMDFIYGGEPQTEDERIKQENTPKW